ncbi:MAG: S9 family peptidase, partial [Flavobacteriales bacterium]
MKITKLLVAVAVLALTGSNVAKAQRGGINWTKDGSGYYTNAGGEIVSITLPKNERKTVISKSLLTTATGAVLPVRSFQLTDDGTKALIYTNTKRVWRQDSRGDYWVADITNNKLTQIGKDKPASSLMFAKFSPDGSKVAYVSGHNIYVEDLASGASKALTTNGTDRMINGTFDWVYEEEFGCLDGFRWSPDGKSIAYWEIDATKIKNFLMINNTDSIYAFNVPVEYPKVGQDPSACKIGVVDIATAKTNWLAVPGSAIQNYIPRMQWIPNTNEIILQQLNRDQNHSKLFVANVTANTITEIYKETNTSWIDAQDQFVWLNGNKEFIYQTEKDGYNHFYRVSKDGKKETLITKGNYDVIDLSLIDEKNNTIYFMASPTNATQKYLYKTKLDGKGKLEMVTPSVMPGTHSYSISPNGLFARHSYNSSTVQPVTEWMNFAAGQPLT